MNDISIVEISPLANVNSGDYFYRAENPFSALAELKHAGVVMCITTLHPRIMYLMANADIVVLNNICDPDVLAAVQDRNERSLPTVYEIQDDITALQPWNPVYYFYRNEENQRLVFKTISICSALQANNRSLLNKFSQFNRRTALFPNNLKEVPKPRPKKPGKRVTVGWGGSHGHLHDLTTIVGPLSQWIIATPDVRLAIMGSEEIFELFASVPKEKKDYYPPGTLRDYYSFLKYLDIGIAPLNDTPYNRCRSDVKYIEYAAYGAVPVLQDLDPYRVTAEHSRTCFLFNEPAELIEILDCLRRQPDQLNRIREESFEYVRKNRTEPNHAEDRLAFYKSLIGEPSSVRIGESFENEVPPKIGMFERLLYQGLVLMETRGESKDACSLFRKAEALRQDSYLPNLYMGKCSEAREEELKKALAKNPLSLKSRIMLGELLQKRGAVIEAMQQYEDASRVFADWEIPYLRAATVLDALNLLDDAARLKGLGSSVCLDCKAQDEVLSTE